MNRRIFLLGGSSAILCLLSIPAATRFAAAETRPQIDRRAQPDFASPPTEVRYYWASWCPGCHKVTPMVREWAAGRPDVHLISIDWETMAGRRDAQVYKLPGVPSLVAIGNRGPSVYSPNWIEGFDAEHLDAWIPPTT